MEQNVGFARGVNLAAGVATGTFLLLLNSDARLAPDALRLAVEWMRADPGCGVAGAPLPHGDGSKQNSIANFPSLGTELLNKFLLRTLWPKRFPGKEQEYPEPMEVESVVGAFFLVRREVWEKLGGMDERFFFFRRKRTSVCGRGRRGSRRCTCPRCACGMGRDKPRSRISRPRGSRTGARAILILPSTIILLFASCCVADCCCVCFWIRL